MSPLAHKFAGEMIGTRIRKCDAREKVQVLQVLAFGLEGGVQGVKELSTNAKW
jgi:hypothetical protein